MSNLIEFSKSILANGGASYNLLTGELNPNDGFMVAIQAHEETIENNYADGLQYNIATYIKSKAHILCSGISGNNYFIGAWVDNNKLYLDVSIKVATESDAKQLAINNNQLAYFDNNTKESIYIK